MNPQQPNQPQRPGSEYDFFMNPEKPPKQRPTNKIAGSNSMAMRLAIVLAGVFLLIIVIVVAVSILGGSGKTPNLIIVAQDQNELIRVAAQPSQNGASQASQTTQNFAQSVSLSLTSEQEQLVKFMAANGAKPSSQQLAATKNLQTDATLSAAVATSSFDSTFKSVMRTQLANYEKDLQTAYAGAKNSTEKQILSSDYDAAVLLSKQLGDPEE